MKRITRKEILLVEKKGDGKFEVIGNVPIATAKMIKPDGDFLEATVTMTMSYENFIKNAAIEKIEPVQV